MFLYESLEPIHESEFLFSQVDRSDAVRRDLYRQLGSGHDFLLAVAHDRRPTLPRSAPVHAVQVHEPYRLVLLVVVGGRALESRADERQVGVRVFRLGGPLLVRELGAEIEFVVDVAGVGRKDLVEDPDELLQLRLIVLQPLCEPLVQITRRRVVGDVERLGIAGELRPELLGQLRPDIDEVRAERGPDPERGLERRASRRSRLDTLPP